jgi:hypothetical protein
MGEEIVKDLGSTAWRCLPAGLRMKVEHLHD